MVHEVNSGYESCDVVYVFWSCRIVAVKNKVILNLRCSQGSHAVLKVLNCEIDFQDFEKVLYLSKMYIKH